MRRLVVFAAVSALVIALAGNRAQAATTTINVTAQGATAYLFNGTSPNGTLTLARGQTYLFQVNATGHPFHVTTAPGLPVQDYVDPGLSGSGTASGPLTFTVPASAPAQLFYQCGVHTAMTGSIAIAAAPAVPASGTLGLILLAVGALAGGLVMLRKRARA